MAKNLTTKILEAHLVEGELIPGSEISIRIDHTLLQDATGTMAMLEFIAMGLPRVKVGLAAQYIDHNLLQTDYKNADDHAFLTSAAMKFGVHLSRPGNGVSHQVHLERFGVPGMTLLGADSHSPTAAGLLDARPSVPADWMWPWPWPDIPSICPVRRCLGSS